jgi:hypothetical protein
VSSENEKEGQANPVDGKNINISKKIRLIKIRNLKISDKPPAEVFYNTLLLPAFLDSSDI